MPQLKFYGDSLAIGSVGDRQVVAQPASKAASPPIPVDRYCRNGKHPHAQLLNLMNQAGNQAMLHRTKQVFYAYGPMGVGTAIPNGASLARWRFSFHTSPYSHALFCWVAMLPDYVYPIAVANGQCKLEVFSDTAEASLVASQTFTYGLNPHDTTTTTPGFQDIKILTGFLDGLTADTDYYAKWTGLDYGALQSCCVFDLQSMTESFSGYLPANVTSHTAIVDKDRQDLVTISNALWKRCGAQVLNWSVDDQTAPKTTASATLTNIIDTTLTGAPTSATPGYTLDMTGKARISQTTGVPCVMKAWGKISAGTGGTVYLKDSSNTTIASCTNFGTTAGWISSGSFNLPATTGKFDLQFAVGGGATFSLYAVSIYEHDS